MGGLSRAVLALIILALIFALALPVIADWYETLRIVCAARNAGRILACVDS
jgi:Tfp pilus assembly protein FimT